MSINMLVSIFIIVSSVPMFLYWAFQVYLLMRTNKRTAPPPSRFGTGLQMLTV
jgi:hypothetical protein